MDMAVEASDLTKYFGDLLAVDHINLEIDRREIFGFLGPNGAGKTTTVRMLTGILKPSDGRVYVLGYDVQREALKAKRLMGIVPEMANAYIDLSAWQNLLFMGEIYGVPRGVREKRSEELLKLFGLHERRDSLVKGFSKGMKQRLLLAMALINDPQILFLDEPTAGLDVQSARLIRDLIKRFHREGVTIFLTTHNMEEAAQLCDRVAIIHKGRIIALDQPERLRTRIRCTQSVEVSFDGSPNIDDFRALPGVSDVVEAGDRVRLYTGDPGSLVCQVVDYARSHNLRLLSLKTLSPSLEEVFIRLTEETEIC